VFALFFVTVFAMALTIIGFTGYTVYKTMSGFDYNAAKCVNQAIKGIK
jgi:hypothetical protein